MAQDKELELGPGGRRRSRKALPVDRFGTVYPDHSDYSEATDRAEDIVDAEILAETGSPEGSQDSSGSQRERLKDRAREFFGAKTRARTEDRDKQRRIDEARAASDEEGLDERERLLTLRSETILAGEKYMASLRDSKILVPGFNDEGREREFDAMHQVYMQMMMQSCLKPLTRGVNPNSIIQAAGMMIAMRMLSPDFRKEMDSYLGPFRDTVTERMEARTRSMGVIAENRAANHNRLLDAHTQKEAQRRQRAGLALGEEFIEGREAKKTSRGDYLSKKWQRRLDDLERRERGNREMFTPTSAAMTEVALMENAFWKMRDPSQDSKQIHASYKAMRKRLRDQMDADGVERTEVVRRARMIIGERMDSEPELRLMFNGLAHGRISKAPAHPERMAGTDRVREVWTGEFDDHLGHQIPAEGMFTLRQPMTADEHQVQLAETMKAAMLDGIHRCDPQALAGSVMGYMIGFAAKKQGLDTRGLPPVLQQRFDQSENMLAAMDIDAIPAEEQQRVYSNAYVDAVEQINKEDADFGHELKLALGEDWEARMRDAIEDPHAFFAEQRRRPKPFRQGPGPSARQETDQTRAHHDRGTDDYQPA